MHPVAAVAPLRPLPVLGRFQLLNQLLVAVEALGCGQEAHEVVCQVVHQVVHAWLGRLGVELALLGLLVHPGLLFFLADGCLVLVLVFDLELHELLGALVSAFHSVPQLLGLIQILYVMLQLVAVEQLHLLHFVLQGSLGLLAGDLVLVGFAAGLVPSVTSLPEGPQDLLGSGFKYFGEVLIVVVANELHLRLNGRVLLGHLHFEFEEEGSLAELDLELAGFLEELDLVVLQLVELLILLWCPQNSLDLRELSPGGDEVVVLQDVLQKLKHCKGLGLALPVSGACVLGASQLLHHGFGLLAQGLN
mmetsp:Transcript_21763/g.33608  ORF Transcript_21763/g.33608 Transcript_21763/m.33608 type:complete len:305 (-) Transcript_21763:265-1179(-)